jgi:DNA-binding PadR family transcriptional regulator
MMLLQQHNERGRAARERAGGCGCEMAWRVRVYRLTAAGRKRLAAERTKWERMTQAIAGILNPSVPEGES